MDSQKQYFWAQAGHASQIQKNLTQHFIFYNLRFVANFQVARGTQGESPQQSTSEFLSVLLIKKDNVLKEPKISLKWLFF